jgi:hypothetical protein
MVARLIQQQFEANRSFELPPRGRGEESVLVHSRGTNLAGARVHHHGLAAETGSWWKLAAWWPATTCSITWLDCRSLPTPNRCHPPTSPTWPTWPPTCARSSRRPPVLVSVRLHVGTTKRVWIRRCNHVTRALDPRHRASISDKRQRAWGHSARATRRAMRMCGQRAGTLEVSWTLRADREARHRIGRVPCQ